MAGEEKRGEGHCWMRSVNILVIAANMRSSHLERRLGWGGEPAVRKGRGEADPGDGREFLPVKIEFEGRRLTFGCPRALAGRSLRQAAFHHEHDGAAIARRPRRDLGPLFVFPFEDFVLLALARLSGGLLRAVRCLNAKGWT